MKMNSFSVLLSQHFLQKSNHDFIEKRYFAGRFLIFMAFSFYFTQIFSRKHNKNTKLSSSTILTETKMSQKKVQKCVICKISGPEGYFLFPTNEKLRDQWIKECPESEGIISKDGKISPGKKVCFRHFDPNEVKIVNQRYRLEPG